MGTPLRLSILMLLMATTGSCCFIAGSWLFFPDFTDGVCTTASSWQPVDRGTDLYIAGSACFLMQALVGLLKMHYQTLRPLKLKSRIESSPLPQSLLQIEGPS